MRQLQHRDSDVRMTVFIYIYIQASQVRNLTLNVSRERPSQDLHWSFINYNGQVLRTEPARRETSEQILLE